MTPNQITHAIIEAAIEIHRRLGPGLLESVYTSVLEFELRKRGLREVPIPVIWDSVQLEVGFRADLIVEERVVVEIKSIEAVAPVHKKQLLTYLRLCDLHLGLLINFNVDILKYGVCRIVNGFDDSVPASAPSVNSARNHLTPSPPARSGQEPFLAEHTQCTENESPDL